MTRLGHGALKLARDWVSPADIVGSALNRLRAVLTPLALSVEVPAELPLLYVHAALIEQALVNVLENAARFSPAQGRLLLSAGATDSEVFLPWPTRGQGSLKRSGRKSSICSIPPRAVIGAGRARGWDWRSARAWSVPMAGASAWPMASTGAAPASRCTYPCRHSRAWTMKLERR